MTLIPIEGMDAKSIDSTDTKSSGGSFSPFPCVSKPKWSTHTGVVMKAELKTLEFKNEANDNISMFVANGEYGTELLVPLDWKRVAPGTADVQKQQQQNLETLQKAIKVLGCHTNGKLDTTKIEKAHGMCVEFIGQHKGFRQNKDKTRWFHDIKCYFKGGVEDMRDVVVVEMPPLPGQPHYASTGTDDDIPI